MRGTRRRVCGHGTNDVTAQRRGIRRTAHRCVRGAGDCGSHAIRQSLAAKLPASMMPVFIAALDVLPLLPNGKVDRQSLRAMPVAPRALPAGRALEELVLSLWTERLPSPPTSLQSDFHLLGGDSLALVEFLTEISDILGRSISSTDIPQPLTVAAMAQALD